MKVRIKGNSIRYRLTKPEVESFAEGNTLKEETHFINRILSYALQQTDASVISAEFDGATITVFMPGSMTREWANTERVGFETEDGALNIAIEKDFKCLDNVAEDQSDNYPNPLAVYSYEQK